MPFKVTIVSDLALCLPVVSLLRNCCSFRKTLTMAMVSATLPGVPQTGSSFHPNARASSQHTSITADPTNLSPILQQERSFFYQHSRPQQIRPQKSPLYVPAVYRPTERPVRQPLTPPLGADTNFDGTRSPAAQRTSGEASGVARIVTDEWNEAALGKVTGLPTKNHWKVSQDILLFGVAH